MKKNKTIIVGTLIVILVLGFANFGLADKTGVKQENTLGVTAVNPGSMASVVVKKSNVEILNKSGVGTSSEGTGSVGITNPGGIGITNQGSVSDKTGDDTKGVGNAQTLTAQKKGLVEKPKSITASANRTTVGKVGVQKIQVQKLIRRYNQTRLTYNTARLKYKDSRDKWISTRNNYRNMAVKNKVNKTEFNKTIMQGQRFVLNADNTMVRYLQVVRARVELVESMDNSDKQMVLSEIDSDIEWFEKKKPELENIIDGKELIVGAREVRVRWRTTRVLVKKTTGIVINSKVNSIIGKSQRVSQKIEAKIVHLEQQGYDTTKLRAQLADYNGKVELARNRHEKARGKFSDVGDVEGADQLLREGNALVRESNQHLKQSYVVLKEIIREFKKENVGEIKNG